MEKRKLISSCHHVQGEPLRSFSVLVSWFLFVFSTIRNLTKVKCHYLLVILSHPAIYHKAIFYCFWSRYTVRSVFISRITKLCKFPKFTCILSVSKRVKYNSIRVPICYEKLSVIVQTFSHWNYQSSGKDWSQNFSFRNCLKYISDF